MKSGPSHTGGVMPSWLPSVNKRVINPAQRWWAPYLWPFALVTHRGRVSGKDFTIPISAFGRGGRLVVPLVYGAETDWVRNVLAAGGGTLRRTGRTYRMVNPQVIVDSAAEKLPRMAVLAVRKVPVLIFDIEPAGS